MWVFSRSAGSAGLEFNCVCTRLTIAARMNSQHFPIRGGVMLESPVITCSPRHLPRSEWPRAASNAIKQNPGNRPPGLEDERDAARERGRETRARRDPLLGRRWREPHCGLHRDARPRPTRSHPVAPQCLEREGQRALRGVRHRPAGAHRALDSTGLAGRRGLLVEPRHRHPADRPPIGRP